MNGTSGITVPSDIASISDKGISDWRNPNDWSTQFLTSSAIRTAILFISATCAAIALVSNYSFANYIFSVNNLSA